ncbi:MAG: insulinase family protein [Rikenellaceae bacterium]
MGKTSLRLLLLGTFICIALSTFGSSVSDSDLRYGVLDNNMTYYIRHNARPKGQADFYILANVGAIQEEDHQQGLAHFLEHMAFNGTENMPGKEIINYLESVGVKFGANLNASTSWDETIYMMKDVPVARQSVVDSALLILYDWAGAIDPHDEEIDKERGVIKEELRTRDNADWRSVLSMIAALGGGTKYEERNLIGTLEGLSKFDPTALLEFYHDWYNPTHQAIIIVGDVDAEQVERDLIALMSQLPAAADSAPHKEVIKIPENQEPIVCVYTDKEMQYSSINYFIKRHITPNESIASREQTIRDFVSFIQNERIEEVVMSPDAAILGGYMDVGRVGVIPSLDATTYMAQSVEGGVESALRELVTQMERTRRYGFTETEMERARRSLLRSTQSSYLGHGDRTNNSYVSEYIDNYLYNTPVLSAREQWLQDSVEISSISLSEVIDMLPTILDNSNHLIFINSPLKEGLAVISESQVMAIINEVRQSQITPPDESQQNSNLLSDEQIAQIDEAKTTIKSKREDKSLGTVEYTLSNGIRVAVKPTTLRQEEILMRGVASGGASRLSDAQYFSGYVLSSVMSQCGLADLSAIELTRHLSGTIANVSSWVNDYWHGVSGNCSPTDLEIMMQLMYLTLTDPRFDQSDFDTFRRQLHENIENEVLSPDYQAERHFNKVAYGDHPHQQMLSVEMVDGFNFEDFATIHQMLYSDCDDLRFIFAGNIDLASFEPLMLRYFGALPTTRRNRTMSYVDDGVRIVEGVVSKRLEVAMEQPKVQVNILLSSSRTKGTLRESVVANFLRDALANRLLESVREEQGGSYGVGVYLQTTNRPHLHYYLRLNYDTNVEQIDQLQQTIHDELEAMAANGPSEEQIAKSREFFIKNFGNSLESNGGWINYIEFLETRGHDYMNDYEKLVRQTTAEDVQRMARAILSEGNMIETFMYPVL